MTDERTGENIRTELEASLAESNGTMDAALGALLGEVKAQCDERETDPKRLDGPRLVELARAVNSTIADVHQIEHMLEAVNRLETSS